jgi:hypothetical protein
LKTAFSQFKQELDQLNALYSAYKSSINVRRLDSLGFVGREFPKIENLTPDFLFFVKEYAIIVECKSGILAEKDVEQLKRYLSFDVKNIEETIKKTAKQEYPIYDYDLFLLLWEDIYESERQEVLRIVSENDLESLQILTIKEGGSLRIRHGSVDKYPELGHVLSNGIRIPNNPKNEISITLNAPIEGIVFYLIGRFTSLVLGKDSVIIAVADIYNDWFRCYEIKPERVKESLNCLERMNLIEKIRPNQYIFKQEHVAGSYKLIPKLEKYNIRDLLREPKDSTLDHYVTSEKTDLK